MKRESKEERSYLMNGSKLLEEMIASCDGKSNPIRIFSSKELNKATNNYDPQRVFNYGEYIMFKGSLEGRIISVKKSTNTNLCLEHYINEVVIASQMYSHKNVLELLGCCLETEIPILVYEFVGNTTLEDHIHAKEGNHVSKTHPRLLSWESRLRNHVSRTHPLLLSWESRLRIATEIADAVTYLHTAFPKSIIHRDIKPSNVFLDQHYVAKLSCFSLSISIPLGEAHVKADVAGTCGFIAPDAAITGRFTEKSDVYGFGALLLEILTGKKIHDIYREVSVFLRGDESDKWNGHSSLDELDEEQLSDHTQAMENATEQFLKANIVKGGNAEQWMACAELSLRCFKRNQEERPTMKEVVQELRRIKTQKGPPPPPLN